MVLQVAFAEFGAATKRVLGEGVDAYLCHSLGRSLVTASLPQKEVIVVSQTELSLDDARKTLEGEGFQCFPGRWADDGLLEEIEEASEGMYVAGVAFKAINGVPGIWLDAFPSLPTQVQVLRIMYEELTDTGELAAVSFEEFVRLAEANVVVASPNDLKSYLTAKALRETA